MMTYLDYSFTLNELDKAPSSNAEGKIARYNLSVMKNNQNDMKMLYFGGKKSCLSSMHIPHVVFPMVKNFKIASDSHLAHGKHVTFHNVSIFSLLSLAHGYGHNTKS